jgi:hypothetical protein
MEILLAEVMDPSHRKKENFPFLNWGHQTEHHTSTFACVHGKDCHVHIIELHITLLLLSNLSLETVALEFFEPSNRKTDPMKVKKHDSLYSEEDGNRCQT